MLDIDIKNHRPLREIVYEELKEQILQGKIDPGTRMMEVEMAQQMGVSRTPIREAIRKLEKEGLVTIEPRKGAYVSQLSKKDMKDIIEAREYLEGLAAFYAAKRITGEQKDSLVKACDAFDEAVENNDTEGMIRYDTLFHQLIVEAADNNILVKIVGQLQEQVLRFRHLYYDDKFKRGEKMPMEHRAVLNDILEGNANDAQKSAFVHIERIKEILEETNK